MKILITNDDGIHAYGIQILAKGLRGLGEVYVAAPQSNQSGAGHGLTVTIPLRAKEVELPGASQAWAINGTPADCVKLALEHLVPEMPDVVVSGINNGSNLGTDIIYSGTVAGAMEGFFHGLPAIAISVASSRPHTEVGNYETAAAVAADFCRRFHQGELPRTLLNINVPGDRPEDIRGLRYTRMGWRWYTSAYEKRVDPRGGTYYWLCGDVVNGKSDGNTDVEVCLSGYTSVTPLDYDMTDQVLLAKLHD